MSRNTLRNYTSAGRRFRDWLLASRRTLSVRSLVEYFTDCFNAGLSYSHVNAVRSFIALREKLKVQAQEISGSPLVKMALVGYRRLLPHDTVRSPIRLTGLLTLLSCPLPNAHKLAFLLGYAFLLRVGEVVSVMKGEAKVSMTPAHHGWTIFLPRSKADPFSLGVSVFFPQSVMPAGLIDTLSRLLPLVGQVPAVLPEELNYFIHQILGGEYVFHCLRHGRATDLFQSGLALPRLQVLGRWASRSALVCYLH